MPSNSKFQKAIGELRGGSRTCGGRGRVGLRTKRAKGISLIIEIMEALGLVLQLEALRLSAQRYRAYGNESWADMDSKALRFRVYVALTWSTTQRRIENIGLIPFFSFG